jgi:ubiquinone/menaquinone biosynthesis C-methylase UbiE
LSAQTHTSDTRILDRRTLARDHRRLAATLRPGMAVLDVGAGTGAITADIARFVGPSGSALGIDRDESMIRLARERHGDVANLAFEARDVLELRDESRFDVVTAARALQWIESPALALERMYAATRPGGQAVVLDYTHAELVWEPAPPATVRRFYDAFLAWRDANRWDNHIGGRLAEMLAAAGFRAVVESVEDELAVRGEPGFDDALALWRQVMESMGPTIVGAGFLARTDLELARAAHRSWSERDARAQRMVLRAAAGRRLPGA